MTVAGTPTSLPFGAQQISESETLHVSFTVTGAHGQLTIPAGSGPFSWPAKVVAAVPEGEATSFTLTVTYTPPAPGVHTDQLTVGGVTISMSGEGVDRASGGFETDLDPASGGAGSSPTLNRYTVHVPTHNTTMVLGRGSTSPATLHGFGIRTDEKFYVRASKNLVMQSGGDALVQSKDASLFAVAKMDLTAAGAGSANLLSPGGVMISGGFGSLSPQDQDGTRDCESDVLMKTSVDGLSSAANTAGTVLAALDATVAGMSAIYGGIGTVQSAIDAAKKPKATTIAAAVTAGLGTVAAAAGAFCSGFSAGGLLPWSGTTIVGSSGVAIGSPGFSGFYSLLGLVNVSLYPAILGLDPFLFAGNGLTMRALNSVDIHGVREAHMNSMKSTRVTAGKKVSMEALEISIGTDANPVPITTKVELTTLDPQTLVTVDGTGGSVTMGSSRNTTVESGLSFLEILGPQQQIRMGSVAGGEIKIKGLDIDLIGGSVNVLNKANNGVKVDATGAIKLTGIKVDIN